MTAASLDVDIRSYTRAMNGAVFSASRARRVLRAQLDLVQGADPVRLERARRAASRCAEVFEEARWTLLRTSPPSCAACCHQAFLAWLEAQLSACDALSRAIGTGNMSHLRFALDQIRGADSIARYFNRSRRLVAERLAA